MFSYTHGEAESQLRARTATRVLLVEDNAINQEVAYALLEQVGCEIDLADNGQVAVDKARGGDHDLILMDLQMPVMDGLTATRLIRALPAGACIPIVAMTASSVEADRAACRAAGMDDYIAKPVDPDILYQTLARWLAPGAAPGSADPPAPPVLHDAAAGSIPSPALPRIAGLDTAAGLRVCHGRPGLYRRLLRQFAAGEERWQPVDDATPVAIAELRQAAHALKGVAGHLGATRLHALAATLEATLSTDPSAARPAAAPRQIRALDDELQRLRAALRAALPPNAGMDTGMDTTDAPQPADAALLTELTTLIEAGDLAAVACFQTGRSRLTRRLGARAADLAAALDRFDYEDALAILRASHDA